MMKLYCRTILTLQFSRMRDRCMYRYILNCSLDTYSIEISCHLVYLHALLDCYSQRDVYKVLNYQLLLVEVKVYDRFHLSPVLIRDR